MSIPKIKKNVGTTFTLNYEVRIIRGGLPYFSLLEKLILEAKDTIHIQYYIFDDDQTGSRIISLLKDAAHRCVKIYIMADGFASQRISPLNLLSLKQAGVQFRFFEPFLKSKYFYFGRRLHHKMIVIDSRLAVIGGLNISDRYNDLPNKPAWLDFALYVDGPLAQELCILCWKTWNGFPKNMGITPCEKIQLPWVIDNVTPIRARLLRNDWVRGKVEISSAYHRLLRTAQDEITLLSSYFLPGQSLRKLMVQAVHRGVKIKIITTGHSDVWITKWAERWLYDWLLRNKIEVYEYQKNILHGKLGICDGKWFILGSYNINDLSAYAGLELNLEIADIDLTRQFQDILHPLIKYDCIQITSDVHLKSKNIFIQFQRWLTFEFLRLVLFLFTFYLKQKI